MRITSRIAPLVLAGIVALGIVTVPAVAADAASSSTSSSTPAKAKAKTGTLVIQLVDATGKALKKRATVSYGTDFGTLTDIRTNAKGSVTIKKLKPSSKYIALGAFDSATYVQTHKSKIKVTAGKTKTVKLKLVVGGSISGTVRDESGAPMANVVVTAFKTDVAWIPGEDVEWALTETSAKGTYKFHSLESGSYKIAFNGDSVGTFDEAYGVSYWQNAAGLKSAATIQVTTQTAKQAASVTKLVDGVLVPPVTQSVSGTVGIADAEYVEFTNADNGYSYEFEVIDGAFSGEIPLGSYTLSSVVYNDASEKYVSYWYAADGVVSKKEAAAALIAVDGDGPVTVSFG